MQERGVQSRRVDPGGLEPARRPGPPSRGRGDFWQVLAILALIAATAGWTTVGVIALRAPSSAEATTPIDSFDPNATDDPSFAAVPDTHDAPELEGLLPRAIDGTTLAIQSWTAAGEGILSGDAWSASLTAFLTSVGKTPADLRIAQGTDPDQALDISVTVYRLAGTNSAALRDALVAAWKNQNAQMTFSQATLGGKDVTKGVGTDLPSSYLYLRGDVVYDIETTDETIAVAALAEIPPRASGAPASGAPPASPGRSTGSAAPSPGA